MNTASSNVWFRLFVSSSLASRPFSLHSAGRSTVDSHQDREVTQVPSDRRPGKREAVRVHGGILRSCRKERNLTMCDNADTCRGY